MIYPLNTNSNSQTNTHNNTKSEEPYNDTSNIKGERNEAQNLIKRKKKTSKVNLTPIQVDKPLTNGRALAIKRWKWLQTIFISVSNFRRHHVCTVDSPEQLLAELTNISISPLKTHNSKVSPYKVKLDEYQQVDYFVKLAERGSSKDVQQMLRILDNDPRKHVFCTSDKRHLLNSWNQFGYNALYMACKHGNARVVEMLLFRGASHQVPSKVFSQLSQRGRPETSDKEYPLTVAVRWSHVECVNLLISHFQYDKTVLDEARHYAQTKDMIRLLGAQKKSLFCCFW